MLSMTTDTPNVVTNVWGSFIDNRYFEPNLKISKLDNPYFSSWLNLCHYMCCYLEKNSTTKRSLEVMTLLLYSKTENKWKMCIPLQKIGTGSVKDANLANCVDLVTGDVYLDHLWPKGYRHYGSSHSHGQMAPFFSDVDDASELVFPGLHFTVGSLKEHKKSCDITASIVQQGIRYCISADIVMNLEHSDKYIYNPKVLEQLTVIPTLQQTNKPIFFNTNNYKYSFQDVLGLYDTNTDIDSDIPNYDVSDEFIDLLTDQFHEALNTLSSNSLFDENTVGNLINEFDDKLTNILLNEDMSTKEKEETLVRFCQDCFIGYSLHFGR